MKVFKFLGLLFALAPVWSRAQPANPATFSVSPGDVTEAIINTSAPPRLKVLLIPEKSADLTAFTGLHLNQQVRIVVAGKVRSEPFIREQMTKPWMELYVTSTEDALATVKALLTSKLKFDQLQKWADSNGQLHYSERPPVASSTQTLPTGEGSEAQLLLKKLEGAWEVAGATMNGKATGDRSLLEGQWKFHGNELVLSSPQKGTGRFALKVDTKAEPKALKLTAIEPANLAAGWMLFAWEGATLKIAFYDNLQGRPEGFEPRGPQAEPELVVVTLMPKK
jgi:uncharacterized protein (TIGR03067 family)